MEFGAPFTLNQQITEALNSADDNGNLAQLAAGPVSLGGGNVTADVVNCLAYAACPVPNYCNLTAAYGVGSFGGDCGITVSFVFWDAPPANGKAICAVSWSGDGVANLAGVYANGAAGVGATLTANVNGPLPNFGGGVPVAGDNLVLMKQTDGKQNGLWTVNAAGSGGSKWVLERNPLWDHGTLINRGDCFGGTLNSEICLYTGVDNPVVGVDLLTFNSFSPTPLQTGPFDDQPQVNVQQSIVELSTFAPHNDTLPSGWGWYLFGVIVGQSDGEAPDQGTFVGSILASIVPLAP